MKGHIGVRVENCGISKFLKDKRVGESLYIKNYQHLFL